MRPICALKLNSATRSCKVCLLRYCVAQSCTRRSQDKGIFWFIAGAGDRRPARRGDRRQAETLGIGLWGLGSTKSYSLG